MTKKQTKPGDDNALRPRSIKVSDKDWAAWAEIAEIENGDRAAVSAWIKQVLGREVRRVRRRERGV